MSEKISPQRFHEVDWRVVRDDACAHFRTGSFAEGVALVDAIGRLADAADLLVVGQGTRLFPDTGPDTALDLVDSRSTPTGVTIQVYRPTDRPRYETATPAPST
jgi:hypothetical protein